MAVFEFILNSAFWSTRVATSGNDSIDPDSLLYTTTNDGDADEEGLSPESMPYINFYNKGTLMPGEGLGIIVAVA